MKPLIIILAVYVATLGHLKSQENLTSELEALYQNSNLPGFAVAIVNENGTVYSKAFGYLEKKERIPFTTETILNLGSVSKAVLGTVLVKAIEGKKLGFNDSASDFLPFRIENPFYPQHEITVKHLATHTSSIFDTKHYGKTYVLEDETGNQDVHTDFLAFLKSHQLIPMEEFLENILVKEGNWYKKKNYLKVKPGKTQEYSNLNAALIGLVIENAVKNSLEEYSKKKVFSELGMTNTTWDYQNVNKTNLATTYFPNGKSVPKYSLITYPDGGLFSNTRDLGIFLKELIKAYNGSSTFLKPEYAKILLPGDGDENRIFIGMGAKSRNIGHGGSDPGVQTDIQFNADTKIGRVILCNVNAEDSENLWKQYREIHTIISRHEKKLGISNK